MIIRCCIITHHREVPRTISASFNERSQEDVNDIITQLPDAMIRECPGIERVVNPIREYLHRALTSQCASMTRGGKTFVFEQFDLLVIRWRTDGDEEALSEDLDATIALELFWRLNAKVQNPTTEKLIMISGQFVDGTTPMTAMSSIDLRGHEMGEQALAALRGISRASTGASASASAMSSSGSSNSLE